MGSAVDRTDHRPRSDGIDVQVVVVLGDGGLATIQVPDLGGIGGIDEGFRRRRPIVENRQPESASTAGPDAYEKATAPPTRPVGRDGQGGAAVRCGKIARREPGICSSDASDEETLSAVGEEALSR